MNFLSFHYNNYHKRLQIELIEAEEAVFLEIKSVRAEDKDIYCCEIMYLESVETCDTPDEYNFKLYIVGSPFMIHKDGAIIRNGSTVGPLEEGHQLRTVCVVDGVRTKPTVEWYRNGRKLKNQILRFNENSELYNVQSNLSLKLSRSKMGSVIECRVSTNESVISLQFNLDIKVRLPKIHLSVVKSHVIEGSKVFFSM